MRAQRQRKREPNPNQLEFGFFMAIVEGFTGIHLQQFVGEEVLITSQEMRSRNGWYRVVRAVPGGVEIQRL